METIFVAPGKYVQGCALLNEAGVYVKEYGEKSLIIADGLVQNLIKEPLARSLEKSGIKTHIEVFSGECCRPEIERLSNIATNLGVDIVIAVGGGKTLDTGKAVAFNRGAASIMVPTIAATDAATSSVSALYSEDHIYESALKFSQNPNLILVDTEIISKAPLRFLVAGMGDALATKFEARACFSSGAKNAMGGKSTLAGLALADLAYEIILNHGLHAKFAVENKVVTPSLEKVVEANVLLSGLGWENVGLAVAHAFQGALTAIPRSHLAYHGEKVAVGTLIQMVLEDRPFNEISDLIKFYKSVGLPKNLAGLGMDKPTEEEILKIVSRMCQPGSYAHNMPFTIKERMLRDAIIMADSIGNKI
jgi:glycerol dehydrogenase